MTDDAMQAGGTAGDERDHVAMREYYELGQEASRLTTSARGRLEFERTQEILLRALPPAPATIADIGGGPGAYALWLAGLGYQVVHRDAMPLHVRQLAEAAGLAAGIDSRVGDARRLDLGDASVDAVLLLGPLYHLEHEAERLLALREAGRVVRPGGPVFAAAISRWAVRQDAVLRERVYLKYPQVEPMLDELERTGLIPALFPGSFTAVTHRPQQLVEEVRAAGLAVADLVCVEGAAFLLEDLDERMADAGAWRVVLDAARALERVPELMGNGPHLLVTASRQ